MESKAGEGKHQIEGDLCALVSALEVVDWTRLSDIITPQGDQR